MASICGICNVGVGESLDELSCYGFCRRSFHFTCISRENPHYKKALLATLMQIPNLKWFCPDCNANSLIVANTAFHPLAQSLGNCAAQLSSLMASVVSFKPVETVPDQSSAHPGDQAQNQLDQQLQIMNQTINSFGGRDASENYPESRMQTDEESNGSLGDFVTVRGRKRKSAEKIASQAKRQSTSESSPLDNMVFQPNGNSSEDSNSVPNSNQNSTGTDRLVYISPFDPQTKCEHIINHLKRHSFFEKIVHKIGCSRLVPENCSRILSFVSFRLQVPQDYFHVFMDQKIWPAGTTVKEFVQRTRSERSQNSKTTRNPKPNQNRRSISHRSRGEGKSNKHSNQSHRKSNQRNQIQRNQHAQKNRNGHTSQTPSRNRTHSNPATPVGQLVEKIIQRLMPVPMYQTQMLNPSQIQSPMYPLNLMQRF